MATYRIYLIGVDAELLNTVEIRCEDDAQAIQEMKFYADSAPRMELWIGDRPVLMATATPSRP